MNRTWCGVLLAAVVISASAWLLLRGMPTAQAEFDAQGGEVGSAGYMNTTVCVGQACANLLPANTTVMGFKFIPDTGNYCVAIRNASTLRAAGIHRDFVDETCEVTQWEPALHIWPYPIEFTTGVTVEQQSATGQSVTVVYHS